MLTAKEEGTGVIGFQPSARRSSQYEQGISTPPRPRPWGCVGRQLVPLREQGWPTRTSITTEHDTNTRCMLTGGAEVRRVVSDLG
jgi:hypothetical protein